MTSSSFSDELLLRASATSSRRCASSTTGCGEHIDDLRRHPGDDLLSQLVVAQEDGVGLTDGRAEVHRRAGARGRVRDHRQPARQRHRHAARLSPRPARVAAGRARPALAQRGRGDPALRLPRPEQRPDTRPPPPWSTAPGGGKGLSCSCPGRREPRPRSSSPDPHRRRHPARTPATTWRSPAGCTSASGAALARAEGELGLRLLFERFPHLRLVLGGPAAAPHPGPARLRAPPGHAQPLRLSERRGGPHRSLQDARRRE